MSTFEIKTHQPGRTYSTPHFFILNKGLNSGKPLALPCPNCFVIISKNEENKNTLYQLSMMLQIGGYFAYHLKGSVIPFISINDCKKTLIRGFDSSKDSEFNKHLKAVSIISKKEKELQNVIDKMALLKKSYIKSIFKKAN